MATAKYKPEDLTADSQREDRRIDEVVEITPPDFFCGSSSACPSVFEQSDGSLVIVGKIITDSALKARVQHKVGDDEDVIVVPRRLISGLKLR